MSSIHTCFKPAFKQGNMGCSYLNSNSIAFQCLLRKAATSQIRFSSSDYSMNELNVRASIVAMLLSFNTPEDSNLHYRHAVSGTAHASR